MNQKTIILLGISFVAIALAGVLYSSWSHVNQDASQVSVSTDKQVYYAGDSVHITIQNLGERSVDIYCPEFCALGNFPTRVERLSEGQWQYLVGFCPSIEPSFMERFHDRGYIRHSLLPRNSFELQISSSETKHLGQDQSLRIVYYLGISKKPIYSNEFTFRP